MIHETRFKRIPAADFQCLLFLDALTLRDRNQLSWYDSLNIAAGVQGGCKILYSEDLQHGRRFGDLVIQNPFL